MTPWLIAADRGGTFTDCLGRDPEGRVWRRKILSSGRLRAVIAERRGDAVRMATDWECGAGFFRGWRVAMPDEGWESEVAAWDGVELRGVDAMPERVAAGAVIELFTGEPAPVVGARLLTQTALGTAFPPMEFRLATTLATNALLEGKGAPVVFFVTRGFGDLLVIGDQRRPDLFALGHRREPPLYAHVIEVPERLDAHGNVVRPLEIEALQAEAHRLGAQGYRTAAVALAHSDVNDAHEQAVARLLRRAGFTSISLSSELSPVIRLLPRAQTAVVNAALAPVMEAFVNDVRAPLGPAAQKFYLMTSAGGLDEPENFHPCQSLLSGPAGGIGGCAALARSSGESRILTIDMGGTSTDVARWEGDFLYQFEQRAGRAVILAPSLRIETVAAGGGSICDVTAEGLTAGPHSAGADPGPACYGRGGPLTLTDVNLLLGRLDPEKAGIPLQRGPAERRLAELKIKMAEHGLPVPVHDTALLRGLLDIAIGRMAEAVRCISVRDGCDPAAYALVAFGGAGPQHACAIAEQLNVRRILVPRDAGLLSASGAMNAARERFAQRQVLRVLDPADFPEIDLAVHELKTKALARLAHAGGFVRRRIAELRLKGQDAALTVDFVRAAELPGHFRREHERLYGYALPAGRAIELVSLRVVASAPWPETEAESFPEEAPEVSGPAICQDAFSTLIVEPGWRAVRGTRGTWKLTRTGAATVAPERAEAATAELFRSRFQGIVDGMGELLRRTAVSTNVKERLDYSCALLDAEGRLVTNAPHIPVHLGAMGECVRRTVALLRPETGDVLVTNDPAYGGSHLPDVTVICPVHTASGTLAGYTANRAHHAEIGGMTPGSMPAGARCLAEEGVVIPPMHLVRGGVSEEEAVSAVLCSAPWPTRALSDNLADLRAQGAAAHHGAMALKALCTAHGEDEIKARLASLTAQARMAFQRSLSRLPASAPATERLDDGTPLRVALTKSGDRLHIDFSGTGTVHPGNRNAGTAVVRSVVLYVLRLWTGENIPLNEGLFDLVDLTIPAGLLNPPFSADPAHSPAVVGGNVETSQRLVDTLLKALGLEACSQGTMNNVIFGSSGFGHYETLCGGSGAGVNYSGTDAIHTHMTNTAITDVEILERRYPVRLEEFSIRRGSGGAGRYRGGDGAVRVYHFLAPLTVSLLTEHRVETPYGMAGGAAGARGRQAWRRNGGEWQELQSTARLEVQSGDELRIETPGGGGWGT